MRSITSRIPLSIKILLLFLVVFTWFFCTEWYSPAQLIISGTSPGKDGVLEVNWDSGEGYNKYESRRFFLNTFPAEGRQNHSVIIRYTGEQHSGSLSAEVVCEGIAVDHKAIDLSNSVTYRGKMVDGSAIRLSQPGDEIVLDIKAEEAIEIQIKTNNHSGKVETIVNGKSTTVDLYYPNMEAKSLTFRYWLVGPGGEYRVKMAMPRYPIKTLTVTNGDPKNQLFVETIAIDSDGDQVLLSAGNKETLVDKSFSNVSALQKRYFHYIQFFFQIIFAVLTTWLLTALWRVYFRHKESGGLFFQRRRIFWWLLLSALLVFFLWLLAFWPGVMSVDSLKIWRTALLPEVFINDHPLLNVIYYRYLSGVWNNPAIVPVSHILMMSTLIAYIFYSIYTYGVPLKFLLPFYVLTITSIPVGLYNILLWKDIPFAVLIVFWAFLLCQLYQRKREQQLFLTKEQIFALFLSVMALAFTRHNGLVYLAAIPVYIVMLRLVPMRIVIVVFLVGAGTLGTGLLLLTKDQLIMHGNYLFSQGTYFFNSFLNKSFVDIVVKAWQNYWGIFNINQKDSSWDLFHYFLHDRFSYSFIIHAGWSDIFRFLPDEPLLPVLTDFAMRLYRQSHEVPFVYLSWNSTYFLVLYPLSIILFRFLPLTAMFSSFILVQVLTLLVVIDLMNWRYYYFAFLGGYLLIPMIMLDLYIKSGIKQGAVNHQ